MTKATINNNKIMKEVSACGKNLAAASRTSKYKNVREIMACSVWSWDPEPR